MLPGGAPYQDMLPRGEQGKRPAWEEAMEMGTRQSCLPCPNLLQATKATGGAGLNVRVDSLEEVDY